MKTTNSKHFYFNNERNNFEQQPKRKISTPTENGHNVIGPLSGTTTPKHMFGKLSSSSTSSMNSCTLSVINGNETNSYNSYNQQMQGQQMTINPFEETNRFRLEQSVLSPNLFHVANTSTPERDTNSLWNIDQRAILYPADIQTDESSLMAQYVYDYKMSKQVIPAVEAFWTQNKIIIESPLACTTGSAFRSKFASQAHMAKHGKANSVNSPLSNEIMNNFSKKTTASSSSGSGSVSSGVSSGVKMTSNSNVGSEAKPTGSLPKSKRNSKDQVCQTLLTIPMDFDFAKILELKNFYITEESEQTTNSPQKELNNSIRKKLFDQNSEDLSSSTATTTANTPSENKNGRKLSNGASILTSKIKSTNMELSSGQKQNKISRLPKPELYVNTVMENVKKEGKLRTLASSSSSATTDDCWKDSVDFDDHFASSPKCEKFSNIIHDIGDFGHDDDLHDSVFEQQHRTPPDLSPLLADIEGIESNLTAVKDAQTPKLKENSLDRKSGENSNYRPHHNRFFNFDSNAKSELKVDTGVHNSGGAGSSESVNGSSSKKDKNMTSPNLSPIRQTQESSISTLQGSGSLKNNSSHKKRLVHSSNKESNAPDDMNVSSSSMFAKSIIFMDIGENNEIVADLDNSAILRAKELQDLSFCEEIVGYEHHNHHKREEFYKRVSLGADHIETENMRIQADLAKHAIKQDQTANNMSSNENFSMSIPNEGSKSNQRQNLESTKSDSEINFKHHLVRSQIIDDDCSASMESTSKILPPEKLTDNNNGSKNSTEGIQRASSSAHTSIINYSKFTEMNTSKPFLTSMIETTTFNHDSHDTGYQTNSGNCGNGSTSSNSAQSSSNPSMMIMDTTNNNNTNLTGAEYLMTTTNYAPVAKSRSSKTIEVDSAYGEEFKENQSSLKMNLAVKKADLTSLKNDLKRFIANSSKRQLNLDLAKPSIQYRLEKSNKSLCQDDNTKFLKIKKNSISLNSLENIIGIESCDNFKISSNSYFKPIKTVVSDVPSSQKQNPRKVNFIKSKSGLEQNRPTAFMAFKSSNETDLQCMSESVDYSSDISMHTLNSSNVKPGLIELDDMEKLIKKKHELDSLYMDQSILQNKITPSDYAKSVISKAKQDLDALELYIQKTTNQSNIPIASCQNLSH